MNKYTLRNRAKSNEKKKNTLKNLSCLLALFVIVIGGVTPAFAAGTTAAPAGMFEALDAALKWIRRICLVGAAISVASYAFSFFLSFGGERDVEKKISGAWKKMGATCLACLALSLVPSFIAAGKEAVQGIKWKSGSSIVDSSSGDLESLHGALSGNHVITPADTSGKTYATVDVPETPETSDPDTP